MSTSVASVVSHFPSAENGFTTTTSGSVSSGAATVGLNSVAGYSNGEIAVFVIDPSNASKQTFTGVIDTSGVQVTSVVWTAGTNTTHASGATVVDYATATHISMITKGLLVEHTQAGRHNMTSPKVTTDISDSAGNELIKVTATASAVNEVTLANAATANNPTFTASGGDTNIGINLTPKGTGRIVLGGAGAPATAVVTASETTTSTSYTALSTAQAVTVTVGSSGLLEVTVGADTTNNTGDAFTWMSFALSGANTLASADVNAMMHQTQGAGHQQAASKTVLLTGLTAGSTTVTVQCKVQTGGAGAGTGTWLNRSLIAKPLQ